MKKIFIIILGLSLPAVSFAYQCPDSTNLGDASARDKCLYKILSHWKEVNVKFLIKDWQKARRGEVTASGETLPGGLNDTTHYTVLRQSMEAYLKHIIEIDKVLDKLEDDGVYQLPYRIPQTPSE